MACSKDKTDKTRSSFSTRRITQKPLASSPSFFSPFSMNKKFQPVYDPDRAIAREAHLHGPGEANNLLHYLLQDLREGGARAALTMLADWGHARVAQLLDNETARLSGALRTQALQELFGKYDAIDIFKASTQALSNAMHSIVASLIPAKLEQTAGIFQKTRRAASAWMAKVPGIAHFFAGDSGRKAGERGVQWDTTQAVGNIGCQPQARPAARTRPSAMPPNAAPSWPAALLGPQAQPVPVEAQVHHGWGQLAHRQARRSGYPCAYAPR